MINFERARLIRAGKERLAASIEHVARVRGDGDGFDVLSFEESGKERLIEVKTTKYGQDTPFFVSRNELAVSEASRPSITAAPPMSFFMSSRGARALALPTMSQASSRGSVSIG